MSVYKPVQTQPLRKAELSLLRGLELSFSVPRFMLERCDVAGPEGACLQPSSFPPRKSRQQTLAVCPLPAGPAPLQEKVCLGKNIFLNHPVTVNA